MASSVIICIMHFVFVVVLSSNPVCVSIIIIISLYAFDVFVVVVLSSNLVCLFIIIIISLYAFDVALMYFLLLKEKELMSLSS